MPEANDFGVVWQECGPDSDVAKRFYVPGFEGWLPFFLWGTDLQALKKGEKVALRDEHLVKGIFFGLYEVDRDPTQRAPWVRREDRETFLHLLDVLAGGFGFTDPEVFILDIASSIRRTNGSASRIVLEVGAGLIPKSSKIKSDLVCDIWSCIVGDDRNEKLFEEITDLVPAIDLGDIQPSSKEVVCYYGFCARVLLKRKRGEPNGFEDHIDYLEEYVYKNVAMPELKERIIALLGNPDKYSAAQLSVT
jgi:hypothetical protein